MRSLFRKRHEKPTLPPVENLEEEGFPLTHCQNEIERDLEGHTFITDEMMMRWFHDRYSTSKHLLTLYTLAVGLRAKTIVEIGFGRSSFVLARAASENQGRFYTCDRRDFSYLLSPEEKKVSTFIHGHSEDLWSHPEIKKNGIHFAFLDYFSTLGLPVHYVEEEIRNCCHLLPTNGMLAIHDSMIKDYAIHNVVWPRIGPHLEVIQFPFNYGLLIARNTGPSPYGCLEAPWSKKVEGALS